VILDFLKEHLHASSPLTIFLLLTVGIAGLYARPSSRWPRRFLLAVLSGYWFISTPLGVGLLLAGIAHGVTPLANREAARGAGAVVVLGGGATTFQASGEMVPVLGMSSALRVLEGARVARLIDARVVIASGGEPRPEYLLKPESAMLRSALIGAGVAPDRILEESTSKNTRDQVRLIAAMLRARDIRQFVLVTSRPHMTRSLALFRAEGFDPLPSVSPIRSEHIPPTPLLLPDEGSLVVSDEALYDYVAWVYYWSRGWLTPVSTSPKA
jgi:uncharacterized SAM-binding protein YcdF (DUF218 family)